MRAGVGKRVAGGPASEGHDEKAEEPQAAEKESSHVIEGAAVSREVCARGDNGSIGRRASVLEAHDMQRGFGA